MQVERGHAFLSPTELRCVFFFLPFLLRALGQIGTCTCILQCSERRLGSFLNMYSPSLYYSVCLRPIMLFISYCCEIEGRLNYLPWNWHCSHSLSAGSSI
ncbi:hypothetical protein P691DRAFT_380544 [Macrolepiota fuliginosa MF-IS2]|uniref:Uncharacterized protein n=1 Tax=Macrolepiota fuliginosa MF-IS2 TaxID=1400762 RepID=A0A9P5XJ10_9AGAR|nr:hypothetical protein P691DRAFT_380544 [Macrolepiota fuliginosa MF-IS2]